MLGGVRAHSCNAIHITLHCPETIRPPSPLAVYEGPEKVVYPLEWDSQWTWRRLGDPDLNKSSDRARSSGMQCRIVPCRAL